MTTSDTDRRGPSQRTSARGRGREPGPARARAATLATAVVMIGWALAHPCIARAEDDPRTESALVWGAAAFEVAVPLSLAALVAWEPDGFSSDRYLLYTLPPIAVGVGVGLLSHRLAWDPAIPRTTHGALWGGVEGFLVGALIDGMSDEQGIRVGPWAYGLGTAGALAGGWLGATEIEPGAPTRYWFIGPLVGAGAGAGVALIPTLLLALNGHDRAAGQVFGWTTVTGLTAGLIFGLAVESEASASPVTARRLAALLLSVPLRF